MFSNIKLYLFLLRPIDWLKNLFVFVPIVFSKHFLVVNELIITFLAFACFSLASSIVYVINDIADVENDRLHPIKKNRPIASGKVSVKSAYSTIVILSLLLLFLFLLMNPKFVVIVLAYILLNIFYSFSWKSKVIIDLFSIAAGFMLRVIGGAVAISVYISSWLIITTLFLSLYLAAMKRRAEIISSSNAVEQRAVLKFYSINFIDQLSVISAAGVVLSYTLYTVSERTVNFFKTENLIYTTVFVLYGMFRYMYLVFQVGEGENVAKVLLSDKPMLINFILYVISIFIIIYFLK
ncbi:decaprenyl-phosphate phosphoribosyltransferase [Melioribacteraceae bacterium 4301-Me]|uniref:decaprenyl-phosphate phosphoribosyltransferase n=1 Tax=Pyranulibacter aquaticus TaxID=3163344 RepID=UPI0035981249